MMPKIVMPSEGQQKSTRGGKLKGKLKGDQLVHAWGWSKSPT
jgi:hypothetical protein